MHITRRCARGLIPLAALAHIAAAQLPAREPAPEPAVPAILALFGTYEVVGMNAAHRMKDLDDFILALVRNPAFAGVVNDIVVECGNVRYQATLDRYIAGEDVPLGEVRQVWRNTTVPQMCSVSPFYAELFPLVRRINQGLSPARRLRVLAADPPIEWATITSQAEFTRYYAARDSSIASVMENNVLSRHRKALMLFGSAHLAHGLTGEAAAAFRRLPGGFGVASAVGRYEERYPGLTFTIDLYGCGATTAWGPAPGSWLIPSLLKTRGTRLAAPANSPLPGPDGILYLGPPELLLNELRPASAFLDDTLVAELRRQAALMPWPPPPSPQIDELIDPRRVRERDMNPFICNASG
jgi:hypothetical protein